MIRTSHRRRPRLTTIRRQFDRWRRTRAHARAPLPTRLWAAAAALVPEHGLYRTAQALGISYGSLQRHVAPGGEGRRLTAHFVELPPMPVAGGCVIELEDAAGRPVRVRLSGVPLPEVADFARRVAGTPA